MLKIRQEQKEAFDKIALEDFVSSLLHRLKISIPGNLQKLGDEDLSEKIRNGIQKAKSYNITSEYEAGRFIESMFILGDSFEERENIKEILIDEKIDEGIKMDRVQEYTQFG